MYLVCWMTRAGLSDWLAFDNQNDAVRYYSNLKTKADVYTVTLAGVVQSTDYSPARDL